MARRASSPEVDIFCELLRPHPPALCFRPPVPRSLPSRTHPEVVSLTGEIQSLGQVQTCRLTQEQRQELLGYQSGQDFCLRFFEMVGVEVRPQIRTEGKRRFVRLSLNCGEHTVEEEVQTYALSRLAVAIKAVRLFHPAIVRDWLHKYKKQRRVLPCHFD